MLNDEAFFNMMAVILAGGKGTRLSEIAKDVPKPLVMIHGKPVLQYQIESLRKSGISKILLIIGYRGDKIRDFFGNGSNFGVVIEYYQEENPLGTTGALYLIKNKVSDDFLVIYGDLIFDLDFSRLILFHKEHAALCSLVVHPNDHPHDSDIMVLNHNEVVETVLRKNVLRTGYYPNIVNAGIALLNKEMLDGVYLGEKRDLEGDVILPLINTKRIFGYRTSEYVRGCLKIRLITL